MGLKHSVSVPKLKGLLHKYTDESKFSLGDNTLIKGSVKEITQMLPNLKKTVSRFRSSFKPNTL